MAYGFGGYGVPGHVRDERGPLGEGSGRGGGSVGKPVGYIEITPSQTRFVPVDADRKRLAAAVALGVVIGMVLGRSRG